jgi:hypothetical protein
MSKAYCLFLDDSGPRDPDRKPDERGSRWDWFALGGVLVDEARLHEAESLVGAFRMKWPQLKESPFHSYEIRNKTAGFRWLADCSASVQTQFYAEVTELIQALPIHVLATVVDRPGYNARYMTPYGPRRWKLCRTAFLIVVERAAKFARSEGARLRVYVERTDRPNEERLKGYYEEMRADGLPFDSKRSEGYAPLTAEELRATLFEFRVKTKTSKMMQIADLVLWPVCVGGYTDENRNHQQLVQGGKLLDHLCTAENRLLGVKYSCFDAVRRSKKQEPAEAGS